MAAEPVMQMTTPKLAAQLLRSQLFEAGPKLREHFPKALVDDIFRHTTKRQTSVSLRYMLDFGSNPIDKQLIISARFLHNELPVRLAHRVAELENLPFGLSASKYVLKVRDWYVESFEKIRAFPYIKEAQDELKFTETLRTIYERHNNVVPVLAMAVGRLREQHGDLVNREMPEIHRFLDDFYLSRIGIRMLIGQQIELHEEKPAPGYIGLINTDTSPIDVASAAIADARDICLMQYGQSPEVEVIGPSELRFPYVPSHLYHMVFELAKNSLRAVQEKYEYEPRVPPPIRVVVAEGIEDVTIKVMDEGGGIPRSDMARIWTYMYSTAKNPFPDDSMLDDDAVVTTPTVLAGYGYGLPLSRLYAKYFGGDLQVISMEGYGTDAYLHLNKLGNSQEPLP